MTARKAILHVGTHKTGTKTLQSFLADNWDALYRAGVYVPNAGRIELAPGEYSPGQHHLASADEALLANLARELRDAAKPHTLLSSEEFYPQLGAPQSLVRLRETLQSEGFSCIAVLYLRPQAGFAESIYAETVKDHRPPPFTQYLDEILAHGARYPQSSYTIIFEYSRALIGLAEIFGANNIIVRPYQEGLEAPALVGDFVRTIARALGSLETPQLTIHEPALNPRQTFGAVLERIDASSIERFGLSEDPRRNDAFSPMLEREAAAVWERFAADNERVEKMAGIRFSYRPLHHDQEGWLRAAWQRKILDAVMSNLA